MAVEIAVVATISASSAIAEFLVEFVEPLGEVRRVLAARDEIVAVARVYAEEILDGEVGR